MGAHKYLLSFLKYIKKNDNPFRTLLVDSANPGFRSRFMQQSIIRFIQNLEITLPEEIEQYVYSYILNGSTRIIVQWIRSDYKADESAICELLFSINRSALINLEIKYIIMPLSSARRKKCPSRKALPDGRFCCFAKNIYSSSEHILVIKTAIC